MNSRSVRYSEPEVVDGRSGRRTGGGLLTDPDRPVSDVENAESAVFITPASSSHNRHGKTTSSAAGFGPSATRDRHDGAANGMSRGHRANAAVR